MRQITDDEFEIIQPFILRSEEMHNYLYAVGYDNKSFFTLTRYHGNTTIQEIPDIDHDIVMNQDKVDFVNNQAVIHINPDKYIHLWRDE